MQAVRFHTYGGPEVLRVEQVGVPEPGPGQVLIEVGAVGVTLPVVRLVRGNPDGGGVPLPHCPGGEVAGRIAAVGAGVSGWRVGQRVAGLAFTGAYAQAAVVEEALLVAVPDGVDDAAAVALVRSGQVALGALRAGGLAGGQSVLVTAAAGGVGHLAVQLARVLGAARVVAAVGTGPARAAKEAMLRELGADDVVGYDDVAGQNGAASDELSVDVALDGVGGPVQRRCLEALAPWGRLVAYNGVGGPVDVNELRMRSRSVIGFAMPHLVAHRREVYAAHARELWELHARGLLRPVVHAAWPLDRAGEAHAAIEERVNVGKIVLSPAG